MRAGSVIEAHVTRAAGGGLAFQFRDVSEAVACERDLAEQILENASLRDAARALASEADITALLRVICDQATEQCDAAGATVVEVTTKDAGIIAGCGLLEKMRGTRFALAGSMTERTVATKAPVRVEDYAAEHPRFAESVKAYDVGPTLFAPLIAQDEVLGVVTVARKRGDPPFGDREERRILANVKRLSFTIETPSESLSLFTDPDVLGRILVNLGANAVKFTERGSVTLAVSVDGEDIRFAIRDTGVGIAREDLDRLFQPFTQLDSGLTRRHSGTGLGLFIAHRLAELLGGRLYVTSVPNEGSTFELRVARAGSREQGVAVGC